MKQAIRGIGLGFGAVAAVALATSAWATGVYKWVDDQGVVHYSDQAPPDVPAKGESVLDKQGREVKKIEPPLTPAQLKAKADEEERQRALAKAKEDQARKDRALMQSYTTESEIDIARERAVSTIESQIKSAQAYSADLTNRQQSIAKEKAKYGDRPIPAGLEHESDTIDAELSRQAILLRQKQEELAMTATKYDTIKQRWHEIVADQERAAAADAQAAAMKPGNGGPGKPAPAAPTAAASATGK
jgi:Domain of unknown function (DUF4124)